MEIVLIREKRKTLVLKIEDENRVVVKAPYRLSEDKVSEFIKSKLNWVNTKTKKMKEYKEFANKFDFEKFVFQFGEPFAKTDDIAIGFSVLSNAKKLQALRKQYLSMFDYLKTRALELAQSYNFEVAHVAPCDSSYKWGTFSTKKEMRLNYKLIILPQDLIDYVIIHELCHSKHMNHKPQFWKEVEKYCPNYKKLRNNMKNYSFVLKTDF